MSPSTSTAESTAPRLSSSSPLAAEYDRWFASAPKWNSEYVTAAPFPNIVIDNFIPADLCRRLHGDFDKVDWQHYKHYNEDKQGGNAATFPSLLSDVLAELNSPRFLSLIERISGINDLIPDPTFGSGGIHQSTRGGYLNIHADFTVHPYHKEWHRRLNLLIYLTEGWKPEWGAELELWATDMSKCVRKITPIAGRCVIFSTAADSYHGHPEPMTCPEGVMRRSIALYYYTQDHIEAVATNYKPRPKDSAPKRALIYADKLAVAAFHKMKGSFGTRDNVATRVMDWFKKK